MTRIALLSFVLFAFTFTAFTQTKKEQRQVKRAEAFAKTDSLINSKEYRFDATKANPAGLQQVDLATHTAEIDIIRDSVISYLPYFGRAYQPSYGGDGGIKFETVLNDYKVEKDTSKLSITITFEAKTNEDTYKCSLIVHHGGSGTLSVTSNKRAFISYYGNVVPIKKK